MRYVPTYKTEIPLQPDGWPQFVTEVGKKLAAKLAKNLLLTAPISTTAFANFLFVQTERDERPPEFANVILDDARMAVADKALREAGGIQAWVPGVQP